MFKLTQHRLFAAVLLAHVGALVWALSDYCTWTNFAYAFGVYFLMSCIGVSCVLHRYVTHRSYTCPRWFEVAGTIFAHLGFIGSSLSWCAAHRLHHVKSDKPGDPHSPVTMGYFRAQWLSMYSEVDVKRSPVLRDSFHVWLHRNYFIPHIAYAAVLYALGGLGAVLTFFLVPACMLWNAGSAINTLCHSPAIGYRNYDTADTSANNPILGLLVWGEGWHNNHHKNQMWASIGRKWWEIDIGYWVIRLVGKNPK